MGLPSRPTRITPAFGKQYLIRSFQECLSDRDPRDFDREQMDETLDHFKQWEEQPACVFCGSTEVERWDHLIAVSRFGQTVLGNLAPACKRCDDSKGNRPHADWMRGSAKHSPASRDVPNVEERIRHVDAFMEKYGARPVPFEERLTGAELRELQALVAELDAVYKRANGLIEDFRQRTGAR